MTTSLAGLNTPVHTHVPEIETENLPWRDNAVFCWWDLDQDIYGQVHVSTSLNGGGRRARCTVLVVDRFFEIVEDLEPGTFNSESITVDLDGNLEVNHPELRLRLTARPHYEPLDWGKIRALPPLRPHLALNHFQGGFAFDAEVTLRGQSHTFRGTGYRDRTWGFRDETAQWVEYFFMGSVFEDFVLVLWKALGADGQHRQFGWRITADGQEPVEDFRVIRDASANMDSVVVTLGGGEELVVDQVPKANRFNGWWLPMGGRQDGPAFCEYNEFAKLRAGNGQRGGGAIAHGVLRRIH